MKKLLCLIALAYAPAFAFAQICTPDVSITQPGMYPDTYTNLPNAYIGDPYSTSVQFKVLTDTTISGTYVTITNVTLDGVSGMPPGFSYATNPASQVFPGGSNACISVYGTPGAGQNGMYHLVVNLTVHGIAFGFIPVTQAQTITGYKIKVNAAPVAYFTATPAVICEGEAVTYTSTSANNPTSFSWSFPGGTPSSSNLQIPPPVVYANSGSYGAALTVSSPAGSDDLTKNSYITVSSGPAAATTTPSGNILDCSGAGVVLNANTGTGFSYQWTKNNVDISGATASTYTGLTGSYKVRISVSGCSKTSAAANVSVSNVTATISATGLTTFCDGGNVLLTANSGTGLGYQWIKDGANIAAATNVSYTATIDGVYSVYVTNAAGCSATSAGTKVTVLSAPTATISANGPITFCRGNSVTLSANTGTGLSYQWSSVYVPIAGATNSNFIAIGTGWYRATVTKTNGCTAISNLIHVYVDSVTPVNVNPAGPMSFCYGESVKLNASPTSGLTYQWIKYGQNISGATGKSYIATLNGTYRVKVTNSFGCTRISTAQVVSVHNLPSAVVNASGPLTFCQGQSVTLTANSGIGLSYQWTKYNSDILGATSVSYLAKKTGAYRVVVTNLNGCSKNSVPVNVHVNCREDSESSISSEKNNVILFPNPTSSITTIDLDLVTEEMVSIKIFDVTGKLIYNIADGILSPGKHQFNYDASLLESGIYFAKIATGDALKTIKFGVNKN
jgi:PKD repeat protein